MRKAVPPAPPPPPPPGIAENRREQYEYRTCIMDIEGGDLNQFGEEGWICFSVIPVENPNYRTGAIKLAVYHFRRKK